MHEAHNKLEELRHAKPSRAIHPERLAACIGDGNKDGSCATDIPGIYEGTATRQKSFGGKTVRVGEKFRCDVKLFRSIARQAGVRECLTDEAQSLVDDIADERKNHANGEKSPETGETETKSVGKDEDAEGYTGAPEDEDAVAEKPTKQKKVK